MPNGVNGVRRIFRACMSVLERHVEMHPREREEGHSTRGYTYLKIELQYLFLRQYQTAVYSIIDGNFHSQHIHFLAIRDASVISPPINHARWYARAQRCFIQRHLFRIAIRARRFV